MRMCKVYVLQDVVGEVLQRGNMLDAGVMMMGLWLMVDQSVIR